MALNEVQRAKKALAFPANLSLAIGENDSRPYSNTRIIFHDPSKCVLGCNGKSKAILLVPDAHQSSFMDTHVKQ